MVVQGPLNFNILLSCDYVYVMGSLLPSLFHVICFLHEGRIVTIDQLSFIGPNSIPNQPSSLNGPYMQVVASPRHVNNVVTCSIPALIDDLVIDIVHHVLGTLEPNISIGSLDRYPFQSVFSGLMKTSWNSWSLIVDDKCFMRLVLLICQPH